MFEEDVRRRAAFEFSVVSTVIIVYFNWSVLHCDADIRLFICLFFAAWISTCFTEMSFRSSFIDGTGELYDHQRAAHTSMFAGSHCRCVVRYSKHRWIKHFVIFVCVGNSFGSGGPGQGHWNAHSCRPLPQRSFWHLWNPLLAKDSTSKFSIPENVC